LKFANTLKNAGVPDKQAEAQAVAFAEVITASIQEMASKEDVERLSDEIQSLETRISDKIKQLELKMDRELKSVRDDLQQQIDSLGKSVRAEMVEQGKSIRAEMAEQGKSIRDEMKDRFNAVDVRFAKLQGEMVLMRWMLGAILTACAGILMRLLLYKPNF
jgi:hypothetical protein